MAISLVKLSVLAGAGVVGSVLFQEGRTHDLLSGAFKIFVKQIKRTDNTSSSSSGSKPQNEALLAQVNNLRQELQLLAYDNSPTIIMTGGRSGGISTYGPPLVIVVAVGYGIMWWKGWKFSSLMFVTKRDFKNHYTNVTKKGDQVYTDVKVTEKDLDAEIGVRAAKINDIVTYDTATQEEVVNLTAESKNSSSTLQVIKEVVSDLESRLGGFEGLNDSTYDGVYFLCNLPTIEAPPSPSAPALELPQTTPAPRASPSISPRIVVPDVKYTPRTFPLPPEPQTPTSSNASASTTSGLFSGFAGLFSSKASS
ncbi:hypothetical protein MKW94_028155 [Papaver nudicaule]|uniref:DUF1664 domain-containing protein n=1 Tax=Papaver nudicaule TaxID=74823 RepID=A0AA42B3X6_PAPNU|nr:hypothetical protein [Papaver nudicaule]